MVTIPYISDRDDNNSRRLLEENDRLRAEVVELREKVRRFEKDERERLFTNRTSLEKEERERLFTHRTIHQWHHQSWIDPHYQFSAQEDSDMSHSTLTEQDDLDPDDRSHDRRLNGPLTFCKQPSEVSRGSRSSKAKQSDIEEATTATTVTEDPSIKIAHDAAFETNYKDESFWLMMGERAGWLVGLLLFQSVSCFVLEENQNLLLSYPVITKFLTMLVGAGGNAGGQACVRGKHNDCITSNVFFFLI
jgi:hypothetical protein